MAKKTADKTAVAPKLIPQLHGGALLTGGVLGNKGGGREKDFRTSLYEATGHTEEYYLQKADKAASDDDWRAVQYILDRLYGKIPDKIQVEQTIKIEIQRIGTILPQAMLQAGITKAVAGEVITNMARLLKANNE